MKRGSDRVMSVYLENEALLMYVVSDHVQQVGCELEDREILKQVG